jgi:hypothetical protein
MSQWMTGECCHEHSVWVMEVLRLRPQPDSQRRATAITIGLHAPEVPASFAIVAWWNDSPFTSTSNSAPAEITTAWGSGSVLAGLRLNSLISIGVSATVDRQSSDREYGESLSEQRSHVAGVRGSDGVAAATHADRDAGIDRVGARCRQP